MLSAVANGSKLIYNCAGEHVVTLAELAGLVADVVGVECLILGDQQDQSSPESVLIETTAIDRDSGYRSESI